MADPKIVREWLAKADEDFGFAAASLRGGSEFYSQHCFHFQQAAEKYLKAYILGMELPFERVHDLVHLLKVCATQAPEFNELKEECILLNTAYIETRYPVHWPTAYTQETALEAQRAAERITFAVRKGLGQLLGY